MEGSVTEFVQKNKSQSHLCICNNYLFDDSVENGIYGFPHEGQSRIKSFWRAVASMYNIGANDLIFLYRTKGENAGCQEINGPFMIYCVDNQPAIYYDLESPDFPMKVKDKADCKVRFLFRQTTKNVFSIADNYELIKKYESKDIWGYRHPAVMNIGAARKKSVTSFTNKQTLLLLSLIKEFGQIRLTLSNNIPTKSRINYFKTLSHDDYHFPLDDGFLLQADTTDEAFLYSFILRGLKSPYSKLHNNVQSDFSLINDKMLNDSCGKIFSDLASNVMMETIISPHLQEELDIVLMDVEDSTMLFFEVKTYAITQTDVLQTQKYLDLLKAIFPNRKVYANVIGDGKDTGIKIDNEFKDNIRLVSYNEDKTGMIRFSNI